MQFSEMCFVCNFNTARILDSKQHDSISTSSVLDQGVRIDYALVSPGLLPRVAACEIVDTHPKWSDHAALLLELRGVPPPPPHAPCALSSARDRRFNDRSQPSVAALFAGGGRKRILSPTSKTQPDISGGPAAAAVSGASAAAGSCADLAPARSKFLEPTAPQEERPNVGARQIPTHEAGPRRSAGAPGSSSTQAGVEAAVPSFQAGARGSAGAAGDPGASESGQGVEPRTRGQGPSEAAERAGATAATAGASAAAARSTTAAGQGLEPCVRGAGSSRVVELAGASSAAARSVTAAGAPSAGGATGQTDIGGSGSPRPNPDEPRQAGLGASGSGSHAAGGGGGAEAAPGRRGTKRRAGVLNPPPLQPGVKRAGSGGPPGSGVGGQRSIRSFFGGAS